MAYNDQDGFYQKFNVTKTDGSPVAGPWFVLCFARDPHARVALRAYADSVETELPKLAADLRVELAKY
jgi:hypothetical protein